MKVGGRRAVIALACLYGIAAIAIAADDGPPTPPKAVKQEPVPSSQSVLPEESTLRWAWRVLRTLGYTPEYLRRLHRLVAEEYSPRVLDANLWAFWGFHQMPEHKHYQMRSWLPVPVGKISRDEVDGISPEVFSSYARLAMEVEDPIMLYSAQSGAGFRGLLPDLGRFMGRDLESAKFAKDNGLPWCDSAWCAEEDRHANALARIFRQLIGRDPARDNPAPDEDGIETIEYALNHIDSRQSAEWNASSLYLTMLAHSHGNLHKHLRNVFRDEVKHFAIMSAADRYIRGPQPWRRAYGMLQVLWERIKINGAERSDAGSVRSEPVLLFELLYAHAVADSHLRRWLATLPYPTLRKIFETPTKLPDSARPVPDPESSRKWEMEKASAAALRLDLTWWKPKDRELALGQWRWTETHAAGLARLVRERFAGFVGAEEPGSDAAKAVFSKIRSMSPADAYGLVPTDDMFRVRRALEDALRGYQIENNFQSRVFRGQLTPDPEWFNLKDAKNLRYTCAETIAAAS